MTKTTTRLRNEENALRADDYSAFISTKAHHHSDRGVAPTFIPDAMFDFQSYLAEWSIRRGCGAVFADCGLGKTLIQLVWAHNMVLATNRPALIITPIAVTFQFLEEAAKFGIPARKATGGSDAIVEVINYERIHHLDASDYSAVSLDESSILKSYDGKRRKQITGFMKNTRYRLLSTATAAPNDYTELGTSSEALGMMGHMDMLSRFFKNDQHTVGTRRFCGKTREWRFKGHAEEPFWRWVCSWSRSARRPSDLGFDDGRMVLPSLIENEHVVDHEYFRDGELFPATASGLHEERAEARQTVSKRCEKVVDLVSNRSDQSLVWCNLNDEADSVCQMLDSAVQVSGKDCDESKEEKFHAFAKGEIKVLVTKPKIGAWGLNFQNCAHCTFFPTHSFEQYYQGVRRLWRFGQKRKVVVDMVTSPSASGVVNNLRRKQSQAEAMFDSITKHMAEALTIEDVNKHINKVEIPSWLR
jgi:hypothetical protein